MSCKISGHCKISCALTNLKYSLNCWHLWTSLWSMSLFLWHIISYMLSSLMSVFCVKSAINLNLFPVCSYDSLLFINLIINPRAYLLLLFKIYLSLIMSYYFCYDLKIFLLQFISWCQNNLYWFCHSSLLLLFHIPLIFHMNFLSVH